MESAPMIVGTGTAHPELKAYPLTQATIEVLGQQMNKQEWREGQKLKSRELEQEIDQRTLNSAHCSSKEAVAPGAGGHGQVLMGKRKEESFSKPGFHKRPRQEYTDESNDELDEEERSQFQSDSNSSSQSTSGEVGIIESIQLKNFMCHSMLGPFQFGSNVNFVVGNNGSGKSAVLTALIVGLGGKATTTNRGSSLKVFVKDGENSADVSITLRNRGKDAFKPEVYGSSIIVTQHISMDGSRSYKLKSKTGTLISSKKEELTAILDHFNIQVDNPVSVLTQEMSKHFLQSKNEGDKYKFFMKATQLEQMKADYSYIMETKSRTHDQIEQGVGLLQDLRQHYFEKEEHYKSIAFVSEMQTNLEALKHKMAWAVVNETEKEMKPIKDSIDIEEGRTEKYDQKLNEWQVKVNEAEEKYKAIQDKLEKISEEAQALQPQCVCSKADVQAKRKAYNEAEAHYNRSRTELKRLEKDDEQLRKRIEELKNSADQVSESEKLETQKKIAQLKEQLKIVHDQEVMMVQDMDQFQQAVYKSKEEHARLKREELDVKQALDSKQRQLKELTDSKTNRLKRFGQHVPVLLEAIEDAYRKGHFKHKPIGPLGAFISLKDVELTLAVETCLKSLLQAFCCDNHHDERTLQTLMSKFYPSGYRPQIIVSRFRNEVYDVRPRAVHHPEFPSVLTALEIDNAVVANCLIDMRGIETILLIKSNPEARAVMQRKRPPKNCREAFTAEGDQVFERRYYSSDNTRPKFLSKDVEAEISHLQKEIENKMAQLSTSQHRLRSIENETRENEDYLNHRRRQQKELQDELNQADLEVEKSKHHWQHYEEKQKEHLASIKKLKGELAAKEKELKITDLMFICTIYPKRCLTLRCKFYFDFLLCQRSYSGKMSFDHKNETLSITVQPGDINKAALNDMRSLSGGERSFSTVCFILSLWSIAESPFRCLDEFDVFMDMVNRRIAMDMMLKMADSQRHRQFILLTPQSMSSLPTSGLIRILRMQDPERGQTTLNFQRRHQEEEED
ncbi:Structural maintenance of chromosomes protein 6 [Chelonia mydas]|uniref:Structural maintenance of chromosomes protein 6 n=1 Tax=Chelonia mydas TaxID=8469 RepID=M7CCC3_CHEMY|nr:Structural maintenance of chromosomes protein 6 [Chelonia mydas]